MAESRKVALVTGGSRGIGRAIVEEFACAGYQVAFTYAGNQAAAESLSGLARAFQADARDFTRAEQVVSDVESALGPIDVLVNNAGIKRDGALHNMDPKAWQEVIDTNLTGTFNYSRALMKHLIRRGFENVRPNQRRHAGVVHQRIQPAKGLMDFIEQFRVT